MVRHSSERTTVGTLPCLLHLCPGRDYLERCRDRHPLRALRPLLGSGDLDTLLRRISGILLYVACAASRTGRPQGTARVSDDSFGDGGSVARSSARQLLRSHAARRRIRATCGVDWLRPEPRPRVETLRKGRLAI